MISTASTLLPGYSRALFHINFSIFWLTCPAVCSKFTNLQRLGGMGIYMDMLGIYMDLWGYGMFLTNHTAWKLQTTTDTTCLPARSLSALSHSWKDPWTAQIEIWCMTNVVNKIVQRINVEPTKIANCGKQNFVHDQCGSPFFNFPYYWVYQGDGSTN